jgi:hypothetical protein
MLMMVITRSERLNRSKGKLEVLAVFDDETVSIS